MSNSRVTNILFSGSTAETENSIKGDNWTNGIVSPTYTAGFYDNSNAINIPYSVGSSAENVLLSQTYSDAGCIEGWFKLDGWGWSGTTADDGLALHGIVCGPQFNPYARLYLSNGVGLVFDLRLDGGSNRRIAVTTQTFADGEWVHFAISWSVADSLQKVYINGTEVGTASPALTGTITAKNMCMGRFREVDTAFGLKGYIDGYVYYNYAKSDFKDRYDRYRGQSDNIGGIIK